MPLRAPRASRRHQLLLSLTPQGLHVLHFRRGLAGWKRVHEERLSLVEHDNDLSEVQAPLIQRLHAWGVPQGSCAQWVLAGDILGVALPAGAGAAPVLPFPASEVRTHADGYGDTAKDIAPQRPLLWIHKDWVAELERISSACGLELVELFGRGQMFQPWVARHPRALRMLVERDADEHFLHIYAPGGKLLRTRVLDGDHARAADDPRALGSLLKVEMLGLAPSLGMPDPEVQLITPADLPGRDAKGWDGAYALLPLAQRSPAEWLAGLWRSAIEGIVVRSRHHELVRELTLFSAALGVVGLVVLAGFAWHNNRLETQINSDRALVRKQLPRVEAAQAQRAQTLRMADAVQAGGPSAEGGETFDSFLRGLAGFPPPPATLLYLQATPDTLALVASGNETSQQWLKDKPAEGFAPYTDFPVPASLAAAQPEIHLQTRRQPPPAVQAPAAPAAVTPASQP